MIKFVIVLLLLTGCTLAPKKSAPLAIYDFGLQSPAEHHDPISFNASILVADVTAPVWLNNQAIPYRLAYHDPARIYAYAHSRWAASPAKLLTWRIKDSLATRINKGAIDSRYGLKADYALLIELEEFTQVFDHPNKSRAIVRLRASLIERSTRLLLNQQIFLIEQDTPTPDAAGAVTALISASDTLSSELIEWLIDNLAAKISANK